MRRSLALVALAAALQTPGTSRRALADGRPRVAILDVTAEGMPRDVQQQFETIIEEGLRKGGYDVVGQAAAAETIAKHDLAEGCTFGPCVAPIGKALDVDRLVHARLGADGQSYSFVITMMEARGGSPVGQQVGTCAVCTVAEALTNVANAAASLDQPQVAAASPMAPYVKRQVKRRSKVLPALLLIAGVAAAAGGGALVAKTAHDEAGWVTIGSGGTVALTGLILLVGD